MKYLLTSPNGHGNTSQVFENDETFVRFLRHYLELGVEVRVSSPPQLPIRWKAPERD